MMRKEVTMEVKNVKEVKSVLAKLMATENLTVEFAAVETASFDVKNRVLRLPTMVDLDALTLDLFVGHEIAHALWTPAEGLENLTIKDKNFHSFINVVEDARIERFVQRKYPGLRKPFYQAYGALQAKDFFGTSKMPVEDMLFVDRLNLKAKLGTQIDIEFEGQELDFYNRSMTTETFDDVIKLSEEIYEYCQKELEDKQSDEENDMSAYTIAMPSEDGDQSDEQTEGSQEGDSVEIPVSGSQKGEGEEEQTASPPAENAEEETEEEGSKSELPDGPKDNMDGKAVETDGIAPGAKSITDRATQENTKQFVDTSEAPLYIKVPKKVNIDKFIVPFDTIWEDCTKYWSAEEGSRVMSILQKNGKDFKKKNEKVINYLHKEFEMKKAADQYARATTSKTGIINPDMLFSYKYNEDIFQKRNVLPNGKNHGIVFYLDWSGSMSDNLRGTVEQLINLALFCKKSGIPFAAYAFSSEYAKRTFGDLQNDYQSTNLGEISLKGCMLLELFNEKMNTQKFNNAVAMLVAISQMFDRRGGDFTYWGLPRQYYLGGTPLDTAIVLAMKMIPEFQKRNGVQIINTVFLTDGSSHSVDGYFALNQNGAMYADSNIRWAKKLYIQNGQKTVEIANGGEYRINSSDVTKGLYTLMKSSTGANTCGFFLASTRDVRYVYGQYFSTAFKTSYEQYAAQEDWKKMFNREKCAVSFASGLDELYVIKGGKALEINDEGLDVEAGASKGKLTTAFKKMTKGKLQNRVILQKFIEKIAA